MRGLIRKGLLENKLKRSADTWLNVSIPLYYGYFFTLRDAEGNRYIMVYSSGRRYIVYEKTLLFNAISNKVRFIVNPINVIRLKLRLRAGDTITRSNIEVSLDNSIKLDYLKLRKEIIDFTHGEYIIDTYAGTYSILYNTQFISSAMPTIGA